MGRVHLGVLGGGLLLLVALFLLSYGFSQFLSESSLDGGHVLVIPLEGVISYDSSVGMFSTSSVSSKDMVALLLKAQKDPSVRAVLLDINSPGGTVVGSEEIARAVALLDVPVYAVVHEVAASGAYWIATSADTIVASPMSIIGSIGVVSSYLEFGDLLSRYGVDYERLVAGKYKDMGSPYRNLSVAERELLQKKLDLIHAHFVSTVASSRHLPEEDIWQLATGEYFLGTEALELGLVDRLGTRQDALDLLKVQLNVSDLRVVDAKPQKGFLQYFAQSQAYALGYGLGDALVRDVSSVPRA